MTDTKSTREIAKFLTVLMALAVGSANSYADEARRVKFQGVQTSLNPSQWPILGSDEAPAVLMELFDYTCGSCQQMAARISAAKDRYGDKLSVIVVPVVLGGKNQGRSLELAKLSLSVFVTSPELFSEFHQWLIQSRTIEEAYLRAASLIGEQQLAAAKKNTAVIKYLKMGKKLYDKAEGGKLPLLMSDRFVSRGAMTDDAQLFNILQQYHGIQPRLENRLAGS